MDGDENIDTWRVERLADEPIYCAVPNPSNPDEIFCYGSDEELDDAAKVTRRLQYEEQGLRYLRGQPLRLLSTTLRGPFDKASGWKNPWVPQAPSKIQPHKKTSNDAPAIKKSFLRELKFRAAAKNATPGTEDSMQCQLPSPESNRGVETFHEYLDWEKHGHIRAWAKDVSPEPLQKDAFWAPDKSPDDSNDDITRKRPVANEWLRKKTTKRTRPNDTQGTETAATPTPFPAPNPLTSTNVSAPIHAVQCTGQEASQKVPNRSFELTTPSSTADKKSKPLNIQPASPLIYNDAQSVDKVASFDGTTASVTSSAPSTTPRKPPADDSKPMTAMHKGPMISSGVSTEQEQGQGDETHDSPLQTDQSEVEREGNDREAEVYEDNGFESLHDQSFHYRARLPKQETRGEESPSSRAGGNPPQITHTDLEMQEMQDCSNGDNESSRPTKEEGPIPADQTSDGGNTPPLAADGSLSKGLVVESACNENIAAEFGPIEKDSEGGSTTSFKPSKADSVLSLAGADLDTNQGDEMSSLDPKSIKLGYTSNRRVYTETYPSPKRNHTSTENCRSQSPQPPPKRLRLEQSGDLQADDCNEARHTEEHRMGSEAAVGKSSTLVEGPMDNTLVGCPMDVDEQPVVEPAKSPSPTTHADPATCDMSTVDKAPCAGNGLLGSTNDEPLEDESGAETDRVMAPLSQLDSRTINSKQLSLSKSISDYTPEAISFDIKKDPQDSKENVPAAQVLLDQSSIHQSPWAPECMASDEVNIKDEPIDEDDETHLPSSKNMHYSSPSNVKPQHTICASQQSPWTKETPLPALGAVKDYRFNVSDVESVSERIKTIQNVQQGLSEEWNMTTIDQASALPIPATEDFPEQTTEVNKSRSPEVQRQSLGVMEAPEPFTPAPASKVRTASTPEPEISIKSFAKFNTPSPVRRRTNPSKSRGRRSGILVSTTSTPSNAWGSAAKSSNSSRRVSFAPLPGHDGDNYEHVLPTSPSVIAAGVARTASPPPETTVEAGDEDVNDTFHKHFDAVNQRRRQQRTAGSTNAGNSVPPRFRSRSRLLPSASQQQPASPDIGAMAAAFQEADALLQRDIGTTAHKHNDSHTTTTTTTMEPPVTQEERNDHHAAAAEEDVLVPDRETAPLQSPWRTESQTQTVDNDDDAVAAVLGNLDQFLDAWDVDAAMRQANFDDEENGPGSAAVSSQDRDQQQRPRRINVWD
ncbi:hypothetical protein SLS62_002117 [Diatrype stigma]|uniref:Protamine P1 n=1 Tax=Diatrype stigma TaxID=117547 RepID=A0AAN9UYU0_9PEZI